MRYKLLMKPNPVVKQVSGLIDGQPLTTAEKEYTWLPTNPKIDLRVVPSEGGNSALRSFSGPWAIFKLLLSGADESSGLEFHFINIQRGGGNPQPILPDASHIILEVTQVPSNINPFYPGFFQFNCPGRATEWKLAPAPIQP
jgi:hypothetical protein